MSRNASSHPRRPACTVGTTLSLLAAVLPGCGPDRLATLPARGTVRVDGKPVAGVQIVLHPVGTKDPRLVNLRPTARTAADGSFSIGTYAMADGAPVADYVITAEWFGGGPQTSTTESDDPEAAAAGGATEVDRLGGRFANPDSSTFKVSISRMSSPLPPLDLTTRPAKPAG